ncbi:hypothetical protein [Acrocarpospora catenulata]|uniref:hypothetical protein n=1 Tax=Acrocarpospora catenulata TaxID=2836182 RepID=UPI001BDB6195|nr:hypothetical protein [Acrocarpospora catenulata]
MWLEISQRLRARWHYVSFFFLAEWPLAVAAFGVVLTFLTSGPTILSFALLLTVLSVTTTLISFSREIHGAVIRRSRFEFVKMSLPVADLKARYRNSMVRWVEVPHRGTFLVDDASSAILRERPVTLRLGERPYRLPRELKAFAPQAFRISSKGSIVFNGELMAMASDISLDGAAGGHPVATVRVTRYFDSLCSNELCTYKIIHTDTGDETNLYEREVCDPRTRTLRGFSESRLSNHIGVSTLAITTDECVVVCVQSRNNLPSKVLYAPSGSGTIPPSDCKSGDSLQDLLVRAMERELAEETGISGPDIQRTRVLGCGRWIERGAKPEYFGVTYLAISSRDIEDRRVKVSERLYTGSIRAFPVNLKTLKRNLLAGASVVNPSCPADFRYSGSVPLLVGLRFAALDFDQDG